MCICIPEDTVACTTDSKTIEELVAEGLALGDSGETTRLDLGGIEGDAVGGELVTVGDQASKLHMLLGLDLICHSLAHVYIPRGSCDPAHQEPPGYGWRG
jgi:hypothetical protein